MATNTDVDEHPAEGIVEHNDHPSEGQYWKIFFLLFAITAVEVLLYYKSIPGVNLNNGVLLLLAAAKFTVVVGYFMHLKFDNRILRKLFVGGLVLAAIVYAIYLLTMGVFIEQPAQRQHAPTNQS
ncbi:MAG TPA: cytochrome C oxidase subunit IV family protein [Acidimicrobiales bacterium]|nr:cytochrome C oxidase subunit IV family protein [Acidimicrobiales bacterium]